MKLRKKASRRRGISLAEVVIALAIIMIVSAATATFLVRAVNAEAKAASAMEHNEHVESVLECYQWANGDLSKFNAALSQMGYDLESMNMIVVFPSCEVPGSIECTCGECGGFSIYPDPIGHDLMRHDAKDPTCTEIGWDAYETCSRCGYTTYVEKLAIGHDYPIGDGEVKCNRCDGTHTHIWELDPGNENNKEPTTDSEGLKIYKCACNAVKEEVVPKL